jgi:hypothetical protein
MNILKHVSTWLMLTLAASASQAGVITTTYQQVSGSDWYVDLHLMGDDIPTTPSGFTVYFDENIFSDLIAIATPDETWDTLVIQPDLNIPAPGFYDAYLTTGQGFAFHDATGFRVGFSYFGTDRPPQLTFDIVDANYQVLFSGVTKPLIDLPTTEVPEPNTIILLALGLLVILLKKKSVQNTLKQRCVFLSLLCFSFVSGSALAATSSDAVVVSIAKVSEKRIDRTVFEYVFKVTVKNGDLPQNNIAATLLTVGKGSTIVDDSVSVGNLVAGAIVTPTDTITIRHDRIYPFDLAALVWRVGGSKPKILGKIIDGYIKGATVFWDCNGNSAIDAGEPRVQSGAGGTYSIEPAPIAVAPLVECTLRAKVPSNAIDEDTGSEVGAPFTMSALTGNPKIITPLTTLAQYDLNTWQKLQSKIPANNLLPIDADYISAGDAGKYMHNAAKYV